MNTTNAACSGDKEGSNGFGQLISDNWISLVFSIVGFVIVAVLFEKLISPRIYGYYKKLLQYEKSLTEMKSALEHDYGDLWDDPQFCMSYLKMYESYQIFLNAARADFHGRIMRQSKYNKYMNIQMK